VEEIDYSQYTSETRVAVLASKLGINWEEDAQYYAQLAGIEEEYR
jgi:ribosomal protein L30E